MGPMDTEARKIVPWYIKDGANLDNPLITMILQNART